MPPLKKIVSLTLTAAVLFGSSFPGFTVAVTSPADFETNTVSGITKEASVTSDIPQANAVPMPSTDWSRVKWDHEVVLPQALFAYHKQVEELDRKNTPELARGLSPKKIRFYDDEAMEHFGVPAEVQELVRGYREEAKNFSETEKKLKLHDLQTQIQTLNIGVSSSESDIDSLNHKLEPSDHVIDIRTGPTLSGVRLKPASDERNLRPKLRFDPKKQKILKRHPLNSVTVEELGKSRPIITKKVSLLSHFQQFLTDAPDAARNLFGAETVWAEELTPFISFYEGIEENNMDYVLYYLATHQNSDGSFGSYNQYELTSEIALRLAAYNRTESEQFALMLQYLKTAIPQNNREKAIKARLMVGLGEPYQALLDEVLSSQNQSDGGFGLDEGYESDPLTTLEAALAMWAANYSVGEKLPPAILYVLNQIKPDGAMYYTPSSSPSYYLINRTAESLKPFQTLSVGSGQNQVSVQSKIDALLSFLANNYNESTQTLANSSAVVDEIMTLRSFQIYNVQPDKQKSLWEKMIALQNTDGSYGDSFYGTISALKTFPRADLSITNILPVGSLVNKTPFSFSIDIKNSGYLSAALPILHFFVDKFKYNDGIDLASVGAIAPGSTVTINLDFNDTLRFLGDTSFLFYVESLNEFDYKNNWQEKKLNFASAADNTPALPMYYIAQQYENSGNAGLNVRWPTRADLNRLNYVIMIRPQGTNEWWYFPISNSWNGAFVNGGFTEGAIYEVTAGVVHTDGDTVTYFNEATFVKVSANPSLYRGGVTGKVTVDNEPAIGIYTWGYNIYSDKTDNDGGFEYVNVPNGSTAAYVSADYFEPLWQRIIVPVNATTTAVRLFTRLKPDTTPPVISSVEIRYKSNYIVKNKQEVDFLAFGTDNVALKKSDFYFWDPIEAIWRYIGTYPITNSTQVLTKWYVPAELFGEGYKIKAVFWDYQGNVSESKEWGPFKIIDGAPPVFTVTSPNGGETWTLGSDQTINWNTQAVNGVSNVSIYLIKPSGSADYLQSNVPNTGSYNWHVPKYSSYAGSNFKIRVRGSDDINKENGQDESDSGFIIVDTSPQPESPWGDVEILSDVPYTPSNGPTKDIQDAQIVYDQKGTARIVYRYVHDTIMDPRVITEQLYEISKPVGGEWSAPIKIYEEIMQTDASLTGYKPLTNLRLAVGQNNQMYMVWQRGSGGSCASFNDNEIYAMMSEGGIWLQPENLSNNLTDSYSFDFVVAPDNKEHVIWVDGRTWNDDCQISGERILRYRAKTMGGSWTPSEDMHVDKYVSDPQIAITNTTTVHVVYSAGSLDKIQSISKTSDAWSSPLIVSDGYPDWPDLIAGPNNSLRYIFRRYLQNPSTGEWSGRFLYSAYKENVWSAPVEILPAVGEYNASYPKLAIDNNSASHVLFKNYQSSGDYKLLWTMEVAPSVWTKPQIVNRASQSADGGDTIGLAYDPTKDRLASVWLSQYSFSQHVHYNEADLSPSTATSTFYNLSIAKPLVQADGLDTQTATLTIKNAESVDQVDIMTNFNNTPANPQRGHFVWKPNSCEILWGQGGEFVSDLTCVRKPGTIYGTTDFVFNWKFKPIYGSFTGNTVGYYWRETANNYTQFWSIASEPTFDVASAEPDPSSFASLAIEKSVVQADGADTQTVTLNIKNAEAVDQVDIMTNFSNTASNPQRGHFVWTPNSCQILWGQGGEFVTDLTCSKASGQSPDITAFTFTWKLKASYGVLTGNTISYYWRASAKGLTHYWESVANQTFETTSTSPPPSSFAGLTIAKSIVAADNTDIQTAILSIKDSAAVDQVDIMTNFSNTPANPQRGHFKWTPTSCEVLWGQGGEYVSGLTCAQIASSTPGVVDFIFTWKLKPFYGALAGNTISYYWRETANDFTQFWTTAASSAFEVNAADASLPSAFDSLQIGKPLVTANGIDTQTVTLNIKNADAIDQVDIMTNFSNTLINPQRGHFQWTPNSCQILWGQGGEFVTDLTCAKTTGTTPGITVFTFTWKLLSSYGAMTGNTIAYYWRETSFDHTQFWENVDNPTFAVMVE